MALISQLVERHLERNRVHAEVEATYSIFTDERGDKYLQIDTYGSAERAVPGNVSRSVQFNSESLQQLRAILDREFDQTEGPRSDAP